MQSATGTLPDLDGISLDQLRSRMSHKWRTYPPDVLPLFVAEMDFPLWDGVAPVIEAALERSDLGYPPPEEGIGFGKAAADWLERSFGMTVDASRVVALPDVVRGLNTSVLAFAGRGRGVIVTPPVYPPFLEASANHERQRIEIPARQSEDGAWHLDLLGIDRALQTHADLVLLCHPHNPAGRPFPNEELAELIEIALRRRAVVVSDEIHAPLTMPGYRHTPLVHVHPAAPEVVMTLTSASKAWNLAGLKCGIGVFHGDDLQQRFMGLPRRTRSGVGILGMLVTLEVFARGDAWLHHVIAYLDVTRQWLVEALAEYLPGVGYHPPEASFLAWLDFRRTAIAADPAGALLAEARVALKGGDDFGAGGPGFARLNFATSRPILETALRAMSPVVKGVK